MILRFELREITRFHTVVATAAMLAAGCAAKRPSVSATLPAMHTQRQVLNAVDAGDGDFQLKILRARLDADANDVKVRIELAARYQQLGFSDVAMEHLKLASERAPDSAEARIALARLLRDEGRPAEGAVLLERFTAKTAAVWAWIGLLRDLADEYKKGEAAHRNAIALDASRDDLHNNLGYCLLRQGRAKEAAAEFETALRLNPQSVFARNNLGISMAADSKEAVVHLQSVTDAATAHSNVAAALIDSGSYAEARTEIAIALGYNRHHSAALNNLKLVSELDGEPATVTFASHTEGTWARAAHVWHRFWGEVL